MGWNFFLEKTDTLRLFVVGGISRLAIRVYKASEKTLQIFKKDDKN